MVKRASGAAALTMLWVVVACQTSGPAPGAGSAGPVVSAPTPGPASAAPTPAVETAPAASVAAPTPPAGGRTPMPTPSEWSAETKEVTVRGSSALGCETKVVREYLRVSCRGKNDTGGTPSSIKLVAGGESVLSYAAGGVAYLIVPLLEGTNLVADFVWSDKTSRLTVRWPRGAPRPDAAGAFEALPTDGAPATSASAN